MLERISKIGIVPVIKINDAKKAVPLAQALSRGGLPVAEVTFRTPQAADAIREIAENAPNMLVGAGTILTIEQAQKAIDCGAKFLVSPGLNPTVVAWCQEHNILILPGINTPSEIEQAIALGLTTVKFFPAEQSGGIAKIKAMAAPYGDIRFMPTGGIGLHNLNDYLAFKKICACGGSFMVQEELIEQENWAEIERLTRLTVDTMLDIKLCHVGINTPDKETGTAVAAQLASLLHKEICTTEKGQFVGTEIEVMNLPFRGTHGHIGFTTRHLQRAIYHLEQRGCKFAESSKEYDANGNLKIVYAENEIGGFALHLSQK